jgi:hypothetical protein
MDRIQHTSEIWLVVKAIIVWLPGNILFPVLQFTQMIKNGASLELLSDHQACETPTWCKNKLEFPAIAFGVDVHPIIGCCHRHGSYFDFYITRDGHYYYMSH